MTATPFPEPIALVRRETDFTPPREKSPGNAGTSTKEREMRTDVAIINDDDGWKDAAAESAENVIKGTLLKFSDWRWTAGKEGTEIKEETQLVALDTAAAWVKWKDNRPVEYRMRVPGKRLPEREELADTDEEQWEAGPDGKPRDPWQNTRFVYLVDPLTAEAFTFSTASWGGRHAVSDLADQIGRVRFARPGAVPVVELHAAPMLTKFGKKSKPQFKVVDWRGGGKVEDAPKQIEHSSSPESRKSTPAERVFDDQIPW
jgi:hypothetical protein